MDKGRRISNYGADGHPQQRAIWLDNYPIALINQAGTGTPELAYIQPDHLGTPRVVIDPIRDIAIWEWSSKSEVFGNQAPNADPDGEGVAFELALRFPGQQATDASGMFYNYQRDYDAAVGRYSQSDPIGFAGGLAAYGYIDGRPLRAIDPLGLQSPSSASRAASPPMYTPPGGYQQFDPDRPYYQGGPAPGPYICPDKIAKQLLWSALEMVSSFPVNPLRPWFMQNEGNDSKSKDCPVSGQCGLPTKGGNSWADHPMGKQSRYYGEDGRGKFDVDRGHDHGQGSPHVHEWINGSREPGVPVSDWPKR